MSVPLIQDRETPQPRAGKLPARRRVLMLAFNFPPTASAGVARTTRFVRYLGSFGWEPLVLTVEPEATQRGRDESWLQKLPPDLVTVRTKVWAPDERLKSLVGRAARPGNGQAAAAGDASTENSGADADDRSTFFLKRWLRNAWDLAFMTPDQRIWWTGPALRAGRRTIRDHQVDVIYSTGPPHSSHVVAVWLKWWTGRPLVCDFRDPWAAAPWRATERNPWGHRLLARFERFVVRNADAVILNTERLADSFRSRYPRWAHRFHVITNGFDPAEADQSTELSQRDEPFVLCHPGSLYNQRDPRPLMQAVGMLYRRGYSVRFQQIGHCSPEFAARQFLVQHQLQDCVELIDKVPRDTALQHMRNASGFVLLQQGTDLQIPGKLFEMLLFGKPILALTGDGATADVIHKFDLGSVTDSQQPERIAEAIAALIDGSRQDRSSIQQAALRAFDGRRLTADLSTILSSVSSAQ